MGSSDIRDGGVHTVDIHNQAVTSSKLACEVRRAAAMVLFMKTGLAGAIITALLSVSLVACGNNKSAVCTSADNLKSAISDLQKVDLTSSNAVSDLQDGFSTVQDDFAQLKADAKSQFSSQIDAVDSALSTLQTDIDAAKANPTKANIAAIAGAAPAAVQAIQTLVSDVKSTC